MSTSSVVKWLFSAHPERLSDPLTPLNAKKKTVSRRLAPKLTRAHRKTVRSTLPWRRSVPVAAPPPRPPRRVPLRSTPRLKPGAEGMASRCPSPLTPWGGRYGPRYRSRCVIKVRGHFHVPLSYSILYPAHIPWAATAAAAAAARRRRRQKLPFPFRNEITSTSIMSGSLLRFPVRWTSRRFSLLHHGGVELAHGCHSLPLTRAHRKTVRSTLPWRRSVPVAAPPPRPPRPPPPDACHSGRRLD